MKTKTENNMKTKTSVPRETIIVDGEVIGTLDEIKKSIQKRFAQFEEEQEKERIKQLSSSNRLEMELIIRGSEINTMTDFWNKYQESQNGFMAVPYTEVQLVKGFRYSWEQTEFLYGWSEILDIMLERFYPIRSKFMNPSEYGKLWNMPPRFKVYRGASKDGYSWTLSKQKAEWFVERNKYFGDKDAYLMEKVVDKKDVFAYINGRKEKEVIIIPNNVKINLGL